jgi:Flp pilus assembly protein TadD
VTPALSIVLSAAAAIADEAAPVEQAVSLLERGDFAGARRVLEPHVRAHRDDAHAHFYLGVALAGLGERDLAIRNYEAAIARDESIAQAHANLGGLLREAGADLRRAVRELCRAVALDPGDGVAQYNLGLALRDFGKAPNAVRALRNAARLLPDDPDPHNALGALLAASGDRAGALAAFEQAARLAPRDPYPQINLATLRIDLGREEEAVRSLEAARRLAGGDRDVLSRVAHALRRLRRFEEAVAASRQALAAGPPDPALLCDLGLALKGAGQGAEAIAQFQAAIRLDARFASAHYLLGNAFAAEERWREAAQAYERFLEVAPDSPQAEEARGRLEFVRGRAGRR